MSLPEDSAKGASMAARPRIKRVPSDEQLRRLRNGRGIGKRRRGARPRCDDSPSHPARSVGAAPSPAAAHGNAPTLRPAPSFAGATNNPVLAPWSCKYFLYACNDPTADNYVSAFATLAANLYPVFGTGVIAAPMPPATVRAGMCQYGGCNDTAASNYNPRVRACSVRPHCQLPRFFSRLPLPASPPPLAPCAPPFASPPLPSASPSALPSCRLEPSSQLPLLEGSHPPRASYPLRAH